MSAGKIKQITYVWGGMGRTANKYMNIKTEIAVQWY